MQLNQNQHSWLSLLEPSDCPPSKSITWHVLYIVTIAPCTDQCFPTRWTLPSCKSTYLVSYTSKPPPLRTEHQKCKNMQASPSHNATASSPQKKLKSGQLYRHGIFVKIYFDTFTLHSNATYTTSDSTLPFDVVYNLLHFSPQFKCTSVYILRDLHCTVIRYTLNLYRC